MLEIWACGSTRSDLPLLFFGIDGLRRIARSPVKRIIHDVTLAAQAFRCHAEAPCLEQFGIDRKKTARVIAEAVEAGHALSPDATLGYESPASCTRLLLKYLYKLILVLKGSCRGCDFNARVRHSKNVFRPHRAHHRLWEFALYGHRTRLSPVVVAGTCWWRNLYRYMAAQHGAVPLWAKVLRIGKDLKR